MGPGAEIVGVEGDWEERKGQLHVLKIGEKSPRQQYFWGESRWQCHWC